jgi:hypothetical protein
MPLGYRQVKDLYDTLADAGVVTKSLPEWSQEMNESLGTDLYSEGQNDSWIKRASVGVDRLLEATGLPQAGEELGRSVGELVGNPEAGAAIGGGLPRMGVNMLPLFLPGPGWVGAAGMGALSGAEAYTSTGSPTAGILGAATAAVMPGAAHLAEQAALKRIGGRLVEGTLAGGEAIRRYFPETIPQGILSQAAGQLAAGGLGVGADIAQQVAAGEPIHVSPTEQLLNLTLGQAPFAAAYLTKGGRVPWGGAATRAHVGELEHAIELTRGLKGYQDNKAEISNKPAQEHIADPVEGLPADNVNANINDIRIESRGLEEEGSALGQERLDKLRDEESALVKTQGAQPGNIWGAQVMPDTPRRDLIGTVVSERLGRRIIRLADDPRNGELAGKQIGFSTKDEPGVRPGEVPGTQVFGVPEGHWAEYHDKELSSAAGDMVPTGELDAGRALTEADQELAAAKSGADVQAAVVKLNGVRAHYGEEPIDDVQLARILEERKVGDERAAIRVAINDTRRLLDANEEAANVKRLVAQREQLRMDLETAPDELRGDLEAQLADLDSRIGKADEPGPKPVSYVPPKPSRRLATDFPGLHENLVPMTADVAKLDEAYGKAFPGFHVGPGGEGGVRDRYNRFAQWVESGQPMEMPIVNFDKRGLPQFVRGRHRFAVLRDKGEKTVDIAVPRDQLEKFQGTFGKAREVVGRDTAADVAKIEAVPLADKPETAPLNQVVEEKAVRITQGTPFVEDRARWLDFVRNGREAFMKNQGMSAEAMEAWVRQDHVADWSNRLAKELDVPQAVPPTRKVEQERLFTPENDLDHDFMRRAGTNGNELNDNLARSSDPVIAALARDLARHKAALGLIDVHVRDIDTSYADRGPDGRAVLKLRASIRHDAAGDQDFTMMHELLHGLTLHELANPANAGHVTALDGLRQRVIDSLPKSVRGVFDDMVKTGWYGRWAEGNAKWDDYKDKLGDTFDHDMHTLYGVFNNDEFISQGLTSAPFRDHLARLKAPDGTNLYTRFVEFIKDVLGLQTEGSVLEQLMGRTDELIGTRNAMATAREYGERYFQNQGMTPKAATKQTERAIALIRGGDENALTRMVLQNVDSPELAKTTKNLRTFLKTPQRFGLEQVMAELNYPGTEVGINQLATDLVLGKVEAGDALRVMDPKVSAYVYAKVRDLQSLLGMVDSVTKPEVSRRLGIAAEPAGKTRAFAVEHLDNANKALDNERQFIKDTADVQGLNGMSPAGFLDASMRRPEPGVADPPEVDTPRKKLTMLEKAFANPSLLAKQGAEAQEFVSRGMMIEPNEKKMKLQALQALGMDPETGKFSKELLKPLEDPQIVRAAGKWLSWNYQKGKETGIVKLGRDDVDVRRELNAVPEAKRGAVEDLVNRLTQAGQVQQEQILNKMTDIAIINGGIKIAPITKLKVAQNNELSKRMLDIQMTDMSNPQALMEAQARLAALQQELGPAFDPLLQFAKNEAQGLMKMREFNAANPAFATMRKYGAYEVEYRKGNRTFVDRVNSDKEAKALVAERGGQLVDLRRTQDTEDTPVTFGIPELQAVQARRQQMMGDVLGPEALAEMERHKLIEQPGFEEASFVRNQIEWIGQSSKYWTRELFRTQARALKNEPELMAREDVLKMLETHEQNMLSADPEAMREVRRVLSTWYLGFSPATTITNGSQLLVRGATELTSLRGKPIDSFRRMINATKEATGLSKPPPELAKEREWLWRQVKDEGIVSAYNEGDPANDGMEALQQALARGRPQTKGQQLSQIHKNINQKAMWMFQQVEKINNNGAILAAFDHYMEEGGVRKLSGKAYEDARNVAYEKAKGFNQTVNDVGGKANRPIWAFSGKDDFSKSAGVLAMSMQTYTMGTINQMANYIRKGFYDPAGLKPGEKHNARIALYQLLAVQTALAGTLGLPFAGAGVALLNQAFPELEVNKNLKKWTNAIFAGDAENGNAISDVALNGIPSMFGWDLQSRLSMGNLLPGVSEFNGFQPENLMGPAVNMGTQLFKGVSQALTGQPGEALLTLMPPVAKKFANLAADGFKVRDYNDKPVLDPTGGEIAGMVLGFQPKRLSDWNKTQRMALSAERMEDKRKKMFAQDLANQALKGRYGDIKQVLREKVAEDPNYDWVSAARSAARAAVELQFPRDLRREGSGSEEYAKVLRLMNLDPALPSETARKQFEMRVLQGIGVPIDRRSLRKAQKMDALRMQNPKLTRYELSRLVDARERRRREIPEEVPAGSPL